MSVTVSIPTPLRSFTAGRDSIELAGDTVGQVLDGLMPTHTGLKRHLLQEDGRLRNFVNLYLNETDIRHLASTATPVRSGDVLTIVPSIAGGSPAVETKSPTSLACGDAALLPAPSSARGRRRRASENSKPRGSSRSGPVGSARRCRSIWRPRVWARLVSSISTWSTSPTCSGKSCTEPLPWDVPSWSRLRRG